MDRENFRHLLGNFETLEPLAVCLRVIGRI